jgi:hypothetical protein
MVIELQWDIESPSVTHRSPSRGIPCINFIAHPDLAGLMIELRSLHPVSVSSHRTPYGRRSMDADTVGADLLGVVPHPQAAREFEVADSK